MLASRHASERRHRDSAPGHAELVFHVVGVGWDVLMCGELRSRTDMMGRRTFLPVTERGAAELGALDGTCLAICAVLETSQCARDAKLRAYVD
jgi:hypothetical protein